MTVQSPYDGVTYFLGALSDNIRSGLLMLQEAWQDSSRLDSRTGHKTCPVAVRSSHPASGLASNESFMLPAVLIHQFSRLNS